MANNGITTPIPIGNIIQQAEAERNAREEAMRRAFMTKMGYMKPIMNNQTLDNIQKLLDQTLAQEYGWQKTKYTQGAITGRAITSEANKMDRFNQQLTFQKNKLLAYKKNADKNRQLHWGGSATKALNEERNTYNLISTLGETLKARNSGGTALLNDITSQQKKYLHKDVYDVKGYSDWLNKYTTNNIVLDNKGYKIVRLSDDKIKGILPNPTRRMVNNYYEVDTPDGGVLYFQNNPANYGYDNYTHKIVLTPQDQSLINMALYLIPNAMDAHNFGKKHSSGGGGYTSTTQTTSFDKWLNSISIPTGRQERAKMLYGILKNDLDKHNNEYSYTPEQLQRLRTKFGFGNTNDLYNALQGK